uniref:Uncharacterized protein n=1 Tax=Arundo donax TaxID=35708 RepID=A0A0A9BRQ8_ARUDO
MVTATLSAPGSKAARLSAISPAHPTKPAATVSPISARHLCLLVLFLNCCAAVYNSRHDPWSLAFVAASFTDLVVLFHLIHRFETAPLGSPARERIKATVWLLSSILTVMFSYKVAALMPLAAAIVVWTMGVSTVLAGFYMFFLCGEAEQANSDDKPLEAAEDGAHKQPRNGSLEAPDLQQPLVSS